MNEEKLKELEKLIGDDLEAALDTMDLIKCLAECEMKEWLDKVFK